MRAAVQANLVSFPSQVPMFMKPPAGSLQQRVAQLYFVRNWSVRRICDRYGLAKKIVQNLISDWRIRAVAAGLIQEVRDEDLSALEREIGKDFRVAVSDELPGGMTGLSRRLLTAIEIDCAELGVVLSEHQMRSLEAILLPEPRAAAETSPGRSAVDAGTRATAFQRPLEQMLQSV